MANEVEIRITATNATGPAFKSVESDAKRAAQAIDGGSGSVGAAMTGAESKARGLSSTLRNVATVAAGVLTANLVQSTARRVVEMVHSTTQAASNLGESTNAVNKVFGTSAQVIQNWGRTSAASYGLSMRAFNEAATPMGAMLKNLGLNLDDTATHTIKLTQRAADMASVFNTSVPDALAAIQAGLRGESDPLERFGVSLNAAAVQARALADTGKKTADSLTTQELAMARLAIIYDQTASSAGDFHDTQDGLANATRIATAQIEDAQAKIGGAFLPVMAKAAQAAGGLAEAFSSMPTGVQATVAATAALAAGFLIILPRLLSIRDAMRTVGENGEVTATKLGRVTLALGKFAGALGLATGAAALLNEATDVDPQLDALNNSLGDFTEKGKASGEMARLFGSDLGGLKDDLLKASFGASKLGQGAESAIPFLKQLDDALPGDAFQTAAAKVSTLDQAMAAMIQSGHADEARMKFALIMQTTGLMADELEAALPHYQAALMAAGKTPAAFGPAAGAIKDVGSAADDAAAALDKLDKQMDDAYQKAFGLAEAQDALKNTVADLKEQMAQQREEGVKGAGTFDRNTQAGRDNARMARQLVGEYQDLAHEYITHGKSADGLRGKLIASLQALGMSHDAAVAYARSLSAITAAAAKVPKTITTTIRTIYVTSGTPPQGTSPRGTIVMSTNAHGGMIGGDVGSSAATGGARGGLTLMNELGPEAMRLPLGTTVIPAPTTRAMAMGQLDANGMGAAGHGGYGTVGMAPIDLSSLGDGSIMRVLTKVLNDYVGRNFNGQIGVAMARPART